MSYIIAVDFDGTLCENKYPEIGEPRKDVIDYLKNKQQDGAKLILWSCRVNEFLDNAVCWCRDQGLIFDAVNENLPEIIAEFGTDTRKIFANEYVDDRNVWIPEKDYDTLVSTSVRKNPYEFVDILIEEAETTGYVESSILREAACIIATLLKNRDISESKKEINNEARIVNVTRQTFDRLVKGMPLTPIEDTDDAWDDTVSLCAEDDSYKAYQCKRMRSLFKYVYNDGRVEYKDNNRFYCCSNSEDGISYHSGLVDKVMYEKFPITMPYYPENAIKVICEGYLTDRKNGDYDTVGILYAIKPENGERIEINRFFKFKEDGNDFKEISVEEYHDRIAMHEEREKTESESRGELSYSHYPKFATTFSGIH